MKLNWPTVAALVAVLAFFVLLVLLRADRETVAMLGGSSSIVLALFGSLLKKAPPPNDEIPVIRDTPINEFPPIPNPPTTKRDLGDDSGSAPTWMLFGVAVLGALWLAIHLAGCSPALNPAERYEIEEHDLALRRCRLVGLDAGKEAGWDVYTACKQEAGIQ